MKRADVVACNRTPEGRAALLEIDRLQKLVARLAATGYALPTGDEEEAQRQLDVAEDAAAVERNAVQVPPAPLPLHPGVDLVGTVAVWRGEPLGYLFGVPFFDVLAISGDPDVTAAVEKATKGALRRERQRLR